MNPKFLKFTKAVSELRLTGPDRTFAIAAAVASSVADYVDVPATPSETPSTTYLTLTAMTVRQMVGEFNEAAPFDLRCALELARKFWMTRYEVLHVRQLHDAVAGDYFRGYFNVNRNFSEDEVECLNKLSKEVNILEIYCREVLRERANALRDTAQAQSEAVPSPAPIVNTAHPVI